jgi:CRP-like cAMP-binding protein
MKKDDDGRLHDAGTIVVGDIIGMPEILNDKYYSATAVAERVTSVSFIPKKEFLEMVRRDPSIILRSMKRVCERIAELERKIEGVA